MTLDGFYRNSGLKFVAASSLKFSFMASLEGYFPRMVSWQISTSWPLETIFLYWSSIVFKAGKIRIIFSFASIFKAGNSGMVDPLMETCTTRILSSSVHSSLTNCSPSFPTIDEILATTKCLWPDVRSTWGILKTNHHKSLQVVMSISLLNSRLVLNDQQKYHIYKSHTTLSELDQSRIRESSISMAMPETKFLSTFVIPCLIQD